MASTKIAVRPFGKCFILAILASVLLVGWSSQPAAIASEKERITHLVEGAKSEKRMVLYTTQSIIDSTRMIKKFEEKYPFIKVELYRSTSPALQNKIIGEAKAKRNIVDVIEIPGFNAFLLKREGHITSYTSPESRAFPEGFKDTKGYWTSTYVLLYLMGYNTKLLSLKDIPATYEGFLNPRWKGKKIGFDTKETEWFANMLKIMGEEKGMDFFRKLVAQDLHYRQGQSLITDLIAAGEFPVGTVFAHAVEDRKKKGATVDWVGVEPVIAKFGTISHATNALHPNAAKLYIDFALSKEGQMVLVDCERLPARPDIEADKLKAFKGLKIYPSDMTLAADFTTYNRRFADVLRH